MGIALEKVQELITELKSKKDLQDFRAKEGEAFCKKHGIKMMQLNFLLSVAGVEIYNERNQ